MHLFYHTGNVGIRNVMNMVKNIRFQEGKFLDWLTAYYFLKPFVLLTYFWQQN